MTKVMCGSKPCPCRAPRPTAFAKTPGGAGNPSPPSDTPARGTARGARFRLPSSPTASFRDFWETYKGGGSVFPVLFSGLPLVPPRDSLSLVVCPQVCPPALVSLGLCRFMVFHRVVVFRDVRGPVFFWPFVFSMSCLLCLNFCESYLLL